MTWACMGDVRLEQVDGCLLAWCTAGGHDLGSRRDVVWVSQLFCLSSWLDVHGKKEPGHKGEELELGLAVVGLALEHVCRRLGLSAAGDATGAS